MSDKDAREEATIPDLYSLAFMPGQFRCPQCDFQWSIQTINVASGQIGTTEENRQTPDCPNDGTRMVNVTYREQLEAYADRLKEELDARDALNEEIIIARNEASTCDDIKLDQPLAGIIADLQKARVAAGTQAPSGQEFKDLQRNRDAWKEDAEIAQRRLKAVEEMGGIAFQMFNGKLVCINVKAHELQAGTQAQAAQWISVEDRLPEIGPEVLIIEELKHHLEGYPPTQVLFLGYRSAGGWFTDNDESLGHKVTHWMPLPRTKPPLPVAPVAALEGNGEKK